MNKLNSISTVTCRCFNIVSSEVASLKTTETNKHIVLIKNFKREVLIKRLQFGSRNDFKNNTV